MEILVRDFHRDRNHSEHIARPQIEADLRKAFEEYQLVKNKKKYE
jgi:hypothetical protein